MPLRQFSAIVKFSKTIFPVYSAKTPSSIFVNGKVMEGLLYGRVGCPRIIGVGVVFDIIARVAPGKHFEES